MALTPTKLGGKGGRPGLWAPVATGVAQGLRAASTARRCCLSPSFSPAYTSASTRAAGRRERMLRLPPAVAQGGADAWRQPRGGDSSPSSCAVNVCGVREPLVRPRGRSRQKGRSPDASPPAPACLSEPDSPRPIAGPRLVAVTKHPRPRGLSTTEMCFWAALEAGSQHTRVLLRAPSRLRTASQPCGLLGGRESHSRRCHPPDLVASQRPHPLMPSCY